MHHFEHVPTPTQINLLFMMRNIRTHSTQDRTARTAHHPTTHLVAHKPACGAADQSRSQTALALGSYCARRVSLLRAGGRRVAVVRRALAAVLGRVPLLGG